MINKKSFRFQLISYTSLIIMGFLSLFTFIIFIFMTYYSLIIRRIYNMHEDMITPVLGIIIAVLIILLVVALISSIICGITISQKYLKRVQVLTNDIQYIKEEGIHHRLNIKGHDELSNLGNEFNDVLDQLERSLNQQKQFVSDASHELKTPLAIIKGNIDMLSRWGKDDPEILDSSLKTTQKEVERLIVLCHELLHLTREIDIDKDHSVDGVEVIVNTIKKFEELNKNIHFDFVHYGNNELYILEDHLVQILIILFDNAIKYSKDPKNIKISITLENNQLRVKDYGIGIPEDKQQYIFDRFYKIEESREKDAQSFGLGLAIAKRLLDLYGYEIEVESVENEYSEFIIYF